MGGGGVDIPTMNSKDNFVWLSNCSIRPPKRKNIFLKNKLVMLKHIVSMTIDTLKAILKNGVYLQNTHSSAATHSRIQNLVPN